MKNNRKGNTRAESNADTFQKINSKRDSVMSRMVSGAEVMESGCWEYRTRIHCGGYGRIGISGSDYAAHRVAWMLRNGPIPEGGQILHKCDNRPCVNPDHLFCGTHLENMVDMVRKGRSARGEKAAGAILNEQTVIQIRREYSEKDGFARLGRKYGVSREKAREVVTGATWAHIPVLESVIGRRRPRHISRKPVLSVITNALNLAILTIEGLSDQQEMNDPWYEAPMTIIKNVRDALTPKETKEI